MHVPPAVTHALSASGLPVSGLPPSCTFGSAGAGGEEELQPTAAVSDARRMDILKQRSRAMVRPEHEVCREKHRDSRGHTRSRVLSA